MTRTPGRSLVKTDMENPGGISKGNPVGFWGVPPVEAVLVAAAFEELSFCDGAGISEEVRKICQYKRLKRAPATNIRNIPKNFIAIWNYNGKKNDM
jgi:hypothetical protein